MLTAVTLDCQFLQCEGESYHSHMDDVDNDDIYHAKVTGFAELGLVVVILHFGP